MLCREPGEAAPAAAKKLRTGDGSAKADLPRQSSLESKAAVPMEVDDTAMFQRKAPATTAPEPLLQRKKVPDTGSTDFKFKSESKAFRLVVSKSRQL